jgi:hypothetical protein
MNTSQYKHNADQHSVDSDANYSGQINFLEARDQELNTKLSIIDGSTKQSLQLQQQKNHSMPPKSPFYSNNLNMSLNSTISLLHEWLEEKNNENKILKARLQTLQSELHEKDIELILLRQRLPNQDIIKNVDTNASRRNQGNPLILSHRRNSDLKNSTFSPHCNSVGTSYEGDDQYDETSNKTKYNTRQGPGSFKGNISTIGDQINASIKFRKSDPREDNISPLGNPSVGATVASSTNDEIRIIVQKYSLKDSKGNGGKYTGELLKSTGMPHGAGRMEYDSIGRTYDGAWKHGRWHGIGKATEYNGDSYEGEYRSDQRHGKGMLIRSNGRVYEGEFQFDKEHGSGRMSWPDGPTYEGGFQNGKREGRGKFSFPDGGYYDGHWKDDWYDGSGGKVDRLH